MNKCHISRRVLVDGNSGSIYRKTLEKNPLKKIPWSKIYNFIIKDS